MGEKTMKRLTYLFFVLAVDFTLIAAGVAVKRFAEGLAKEYEIRAEAAKEQAEKEEKIANGKCICAYCEQDVSVGSLYCLMHTCKEPGCGNQVYAFSRCEVHKHLPETSRFASANCIIMGCPNSKMRGSAYCEAHDAGNLYRQMNSISDTPGSVDVTVKTVTENKATTVTEHRDIDDLDVEGFYYDNMDEFEDEDDAWDYLEDNEDEWDDY